VKGRELTVGVFAGKAMPVIEIIPKQGFYDYRNKYQAGLTEEICPALIGEVATQRVQALGEAVYRALMLDVYCRVDCLMDENVIASVAANECNADILYGDYTSVLGQKTVAHKANSETVSHFERKMNFSHQAAFIKREVMQELLYDTKYPICADLEFFQRAYALGKTYRYIDVMVVAFQMGGISYQRAFDLLDETYRIQYKYGIISETECNRLRRRNQLKKFSRQIIPASLYKKLKKWKFNKVQK